MQCYGVTDKGASRPTNQDYFKTALASEHHAALLVVCDGMGGANAGNVASRFAGDTFVQQIEPHLGEDLNEENRRRLLLEALRAANDTVFNLSTLQPEFFGMGTTLVAAIVKDDVATVLNVGDSRAYLFDGKLLRQVTEDHSYVNELRRQGDIDEAQMRVHPQRNLITRAVGVEGTVEGDLYEVSLKKNETLLLCSDGLTTMAEDGDIQRIVAGSGSISERTLALLKLAMDGGGKDNITAVLFNATAGKGDVRNG